MVLSQVRNRISGSSSNRIANDIITEVKELQNNFSDRDHMFSEWYSLLKLDDTLKQENMESFVGNDPRTTWNMATYLLQPRPFTHQIATTDGTTLSVEAQAGAKVIEGYFRRLWVNIDRQDRKRGKQSWFWSMIGLLTATGWYAMPYMIRPDGSVFVDYWNPSTIYPEYSDDLSEGMIRLARVRHVSKSEANRILAQNGIAESRGIGNNPTFMQVWHKGVDGSITQSGVLGNILVKDRVPIGGGFSEIPVIVGFTGGIPGAVTAIKGQSMEGQSILATNEPLYHSANKQQTFMQQLLRDTANPRWFERLVGNKSIIGNPDNLFKRGAKFSMGLQEEMGALPMPPIPVELTQIMFSIRNQMQRGGFSDLTFGNVLQEVSAVLVSQAAEAALQLLTPYQNAIQLAVTEITNNWYQNLLFDSSLRPRDWPDINIEDFTSTEIISSYSIKIPGDLSNRISMAKALNPRFELPNELLMKMMLPEVSSPVEALAQLDAEKSKEAPEFQMIQLISAFERASQEAFASGNTDESVTFTIVADRLRKQLTEQPQTSDRVGQGVDRSIAQRRVGG